MGLARQPLLVQSALQASSLFGDVLLLQNDDTPVTPGPLPPPRQRQLGSRVPQQCHPQLVRLLLPLPTPREEPQGSGALRWTLRRYEEP